MNNHLFVCGETLGLEDSAIVAGLGFLYIKKSILEMTKEEIESNTLHFKVDMSEQKTLGRTYDANTVRYWKQTCPEIISNKNVVKLGDLDDKVKAWLESVGYDEKDILWSRGCISRGWTEHLWKHTLKKKSPFPFYEWMDTRTAIRMTHGNLNPFVEVLEEGRWKNLTKYKAIDNCIRDAIILDAGF